MLPPPPPPQSYLFPTITGQNQANPLACPHPNFGTLVKGHFGAIVFGALDPLFFILIKFFSQDLKLRYYQYMIELDQHEGTYLNICRHYRAVYETPVIRDDPVEKLRILKHVVLFVVLSPYSNDQSDLIHRILEDKALNDIPSYKSLMEKFTNQVRHLFP